ncbi:uncharacterized protein DDB_G0293860-like [Prorops nasuta]|uniref:uncharacterized protein DDB_G0293860-like n=1 Tax=Prorops nasuta TaxID=863751 RepID=UPI0034CDEBD5
MDQEKLIELVKSHEALYVMTNSRYSDNNFKDNIWKEIAKNLNQPVEVCKKTWNSLRDSFRKSLKKKRETRSGQAATKMRKWKFEDEMSFLIPVMQERETCTNLKNISDDENEDDPKGDNNTNNINESLNNNNDDDAVIENDKDDEESDNENSTSVTEKKASTKIMNKRYKNRQKNLKPSQIQHLLIAETVKTFSPYYQNIAKTQIFSIISDLEMKQIMQKEPYCPPNTSYPQHYASTNFHRQPQTFNYPGPSNINNLHPLPLPSPLSTISISSPSPSGSANSISLSTYYDFPNTSEANVPNAYSDVTKQ